MVLMGCLAEMAVAHPTAGSFGIYAELYLSRWAGFTIRYTYWVAVSISVGSEAVAAAIYTQWWFPHSPMWGWVVFYSAVLILVNALSVGAFGEFEYWFSMIKVSAIVVFILLGAAVLFGYHQDRPRRAAAPGRCGGRRSRRRGAGHLRTACRDPWQGSRRRIFVSLTDTTQHRREEMS